MAPRPAASGGLYLDAWGVPDRVLTSLPVYAVWVAGTGAELEEEFRAIRQALGVRQQYEFHARQLTKQERSRDLPRRFFAEVSAHGVRFEAWCAELNKRKSRLPLEITGKPLLHELAAQAFLRMPSEKVQGHTLVYDDQTTSKKVTKGAQELRSAINNALASYGHDSALSRVIPQPAHKSTGLQLADFVAAALVTPWPECVALLPGPAIHHWQT